MYREEETERPRAWGEPLVGLRWVGTVLPDLHLWDLVSPETEDPPLQDRSLPREGSDGRGGRASATTTGPPASRRQVEDSPVTGPQQTPEVGGHPRPHSITGFNTKTGGPTVLIPSTAPTHPPCDETPHSDPTNSTETSQGPRTP